MGKVKVRYPKLDIIRGLCLISMILYHTVWDLVYIYGCNWGWYRSAGAFVWQQSICWTFILLAGFCLPLGKQSIRRGVIVFSAGALITAVTLILMPGQRIVFGVLTLLGSSMILVGIFDKALRKMMKKIPAIVGMVGSFLLFSFTYSVNDKFMGFFGLNLIDLPMVLYRNYFTTFLGFPKRGFFSTDYFSIVPWIFLFMTGYFAHFVGMQTESESGQADCNEVAQGVCAKLQQWMRRGECKPLQWMGRHSLLIYMLHQPVIYGVLWMVFKIF